MCNEYAVYSLITNDYFVWIHKNEIKEIFIKKTYGSTGSANTEGSDVTLAENIEVVVIQSLEFITEDWKHMSVGAGGRGGVFLIPLDTVIPAAIQPTIAIPLTQLKMAPWIDLIKTKHIFISI